MTAESAVKLGGILNMGEKCKIKGSFIFFLLIFVLENLN